MSKLSLEGPVRALVAEERGMSLYLELALILSQNRLLLPSGTLIVEIFHKRLKEVKKIFFLHFVGVEKDKQGLPRCVIFKKEA